MGLFSGLSLYLLMLFGDIFMLALFSCLSLTLLNDCVYSCSRGSSVSKFSDSEFKSVINLRLVHRYLLGTER